MKTTPIPVKFDRQGHCQRCGLSSQRPQCARPPRQMFFSMCCLIVYMGGLPVCATKGRYMIVFTTGTGHLLRCSLQRSLHNAPIFRLLLKVAVNGTHQCDFSNFCGDDRVWRKICARLVLTHKHNTCGSLVHPSQVRQASL